MSDLRAARLTGVLFIIATVVNLLGAAIRPGLTGTDYLGRLSAEPDRVAASSLLLLIAAFACAGIAVAMYPVLKQDGHGSGPRIGRLPDASRRSCTWSPS